MVFSGAMEWIALATSKHLAPVGAITFLDFYSEFGVVLTHLSQVPHICVSESGQQWFR